MRRLRYQVATSLDGYIAGPNGEFDWIAMDPDIDFAALFAQFDTVVTGRKTFLATLQQSLKAQPGKDIWLFGGGELFRTLLEAGVVDTVEPAVVPVLLGSGIPMLPSSASRTTLSLSAHHLYPKSGIMLLEYAVTP